jgi:arylsulfatase A-like enzyme
MKTASDKPNVIVLMVDDLRYDCIGAAGQTRFLDRYRCADRLQTPVMDELARTGVFFSQAITSASNTPPSIAAMFTGCRGPVNGVRSLFGGPRIPEVRTLWEHLSAAGYDTAACDPHGFSEINGTLDGCAHIYHSNWATERHTSLLKKLAAELKPPFAAYLHLWDVHIPYGAGAYPYGLHQPFMNHLQHMLKQYFFMELNASPGYTNIDELRENWMDLWHKHWNKGAMNPVESQAPLYVDGVTAFDKGRLQSIIKGLGRLGMLDNTILVLLSDHGETVNHKERSVEPLFQHSCFPFEGLMRIPFIIKAPGMLPEGKTVTRQVSTVDLAPTLLDLCDVAPQPGHAMDGRSLVPLMLGRDDSDSVAYCEHCEVASEFLVPQFQNRCMEERKNFEFDWLVFYRALRTPQFKYVECGEPLTQHDLDAAPYDFIRAVNRKTKLIFDNEQSLKEESGLLADGVHSRKDLIDEALVHVRTAMNEKLYDIEADPDELVNLLGLDREKFGRIAQPLKMDLDRIYDKTLRHSGDKACFSNKTPEEVDGLAHRLRGLGYID